MSKLSDLVKQRANIRARLTLFEKYLTPLLDCNEISTFIVNELRLRLNKITELSCSFEDIQSQIEMLDEDSAKQMTEREVTESNFFKLIAQAQSLLDIFQNKCKQETSSDISSKGNNNVKLPLLKIPSFNGDPNKWLSFRDMYLSLIHNNESIEDINKFHYLKSYLEGSASSVVDSVTVSSLNYAVAWNLLCERFNNKRLLINEHIKSLFSIEPLHKETENGIHNLIDVLSKNLSALNSLGEPTDKWDSLIIYMASAKLDSATARNWEEFRSSKDTITLQDFYSFLRQRASVVETVNARRSSKFEKRHSLSKSFVAPSVESPSKLCNICKSNHKIYECPKFKSLPVFERIAKISALRLCSNCFRSGHQPYQCRLGGCRICQKKHNTLLHKQNSLQHAIDQTNSTAHLVNKDNTQNDLPNPVDTAVPSSSTTMSAVSTNLTLLSTALVKVTCNDKIFVLRALLDSGSQSSFISERAHTMIGSHKKRNSYQSVSGLGNSTINVTEHCNVNLNSLYNSFNINVKCFILPQITDRLPHTCIRVQDFNIPASIKLADPRFYQPADIDLLLGADVFWDILKSNKIHLGPQRPILQETELGWVVAGPIGISLQDGSNSKVYCNFSKELGQLVAKFWELEEIPPTIEPNKEDYCEKIFSETTSRTAEGRFCVQIPLKKPTSLLGESYSIAEKRFLQLERKLNNAPQLKQQYLEFIKEYEHLGHMTEITKPEFGCYLPHHAVIRENSETTKLRVVFDASAKTSTGVSFNDIQHVGPVVQDDLFSILLRYRQFAFVVTADVEKMYRQILVHPDQRNLQMILWRDEASQPIKIFQLNTVTYGTASAPYLSTRCLLQLSKECKDSKISQAIREDFYVDDYLGSAESEGELNGIIRSVTETLNSACLPLRKWRTNASSVFENEPDTSSPKNLDLAVQSSVLGLKWDPAKDILRFPVDVVSDEIVTKRSILSKSAKLFDPLGLLGPCTIIPKIIIQKLWLSKSDWDDCVEPTIEREWLKFIHNLESLSYVEIPRSIIILNPVLIELHSFSDASQSAYAAAIYIRSIDTFGNVQVRLLCAKTKVAPVKPTTIPRLELCGALLSARLSAKVIKALRCKIDSIFHWTDSTVVLGWLSSNATDLKQFVANRVNEIQETTNVGSWRHVPGDKNPADVASRGMNPKQLVTATQWWEGPQFLKEKSCSWPQLPNIKYSNLPECKPSTQNLTALQTTSKINTLSGIVEFSRYSKFTIMQRSLAWVLRFLNNLKNKNLKMCGPLTTNELNMSLNLLIKQHQNECFSDELKILKSNQNLPSKCRILSLTPFIDDSGILRVGGRIQGSSEPHTKKHPILLETHHVFTKLLFIHYHKRLLHGGPQLLLSELRNYYWPLNGRILARSTVNNCTLCRIMKAKGCQPIMGNLPSDRVTPSLPFQVSGVDFAGPFLITDRKGRGCKITKSYLCLFICFATKALHLEVASDLTSEVFILCLRRFMSRRGKPLVLYCDNGTNFVGANNEITRFLKSNNENISGFAADEGIQFKFSPAYSPHFGGLWEAGVKSAKFHATRILQDKHLTFEELSTLFAQIEAILNSRPLTPLSSDPNDLNPLTPAHFLIGRPLTSLPSECLLDTKLSSINRYRLLEKMRQHFWDRWRNEYLGELQQKLKWRTQQRGLHEGDLVIVKDCNLPPLKWRMARIHKLYLGPDGVARVADVYTAKGIIRRAVRNLCALPEPSPSPSISTSTRNLEAFEGGEDVEEETPSM